MSSPKPKPKKSSSTCAVAPATTPPQQRKRRGSLSSLKAAADAFGSGSWHQRTLRRTGSISKSPARAREHSLRKSGRHASLNAPSSPSGYSSDIQSKDALERAKGKRRGSLSPSARKSHTLILYDNLRRAKMKKQKENVCYE